MKPLPLMLALTVLAHAFLGFFFWSRPPSPTPPPRPPSVSTPALPSTTNPLAPGAASALGTAYAARDARSVRDLLVASGLSPDSARNILAAMLYEQHRPRIEELTQAAARSSIWWRDITPEETPPDSPSALLEKLHENIQADLDALFPETTSETSDAEPNLELAFLTPAKQNAIQQITRDYADMIQAAHLAAGRFELPADREKITFLEAERDRDIAALLTPEERENLELRTSPLAYQLRSLTTELKATESEYRAIFALQKDYETHSANLDGTDYTDAQQNLQNQIATLVGLERYRAYARAQDNDYTSLQAIAERFSLPPAISDTLYNLREPVAQATQRIAHDPSLDVAQKNAALQTLARQTRAQLATTLGPEIAAAYLQDKVRWLPLLETGHILSIPPAGNIVATPLVPATSP